MKKKGFKKIGAVLLLAFCLLAFTACGQEQGTQTVQIDTAGTEPLEETTELPEDGVISDKQMATLTGKDGEYRFTGKTDEGILYTWIYNAKLIKNPQEQRLKVTVDNENTEAVQKAANNAQVGLGISLESMNMASPATLELTLTEKWDADSVIFCKYQDGRALRINDAEISSEKQGDGEVTVLSFQVSETGDTYYLVGGNTKAGGENKAADEKSEKTESEDKSTAEESSAENSGENNGTMSGGNSENKEAKAEGQTEEYAETENISSQETNENYEMDEAEAAEQPEQNLETENVSEEEPEEGYEAEEYEEPEENVSTCTISIECSSIFNNWDDLNEAKEEFVPSDGWILYPSEVEFTPGETVFDVLKRVCGDTGIHMSSKWTPIYGSYYIEGINQLYEFDCGQNSGWMYRVNGWYPNYGCSSYELSDGDNIEWKYTCDLGSDIGGGVY